MIFILLLDGIKVVFHLEILDSHQLIRGVFEFSWNLSNSISIGCATCLSVFYFLKLSSFSHPFLLWLKCRRDRVVFTIMLGLCLSLIFNLLSIKFILLCSASIYKKKDLTWKKDMHKNKYYSSQVLFSLGSLIPLSVSLTVFSC